MPFDLGQYYLLAMPHPKNRSPYSQVFNVFAISYIIVARPDFWRRNFGAPHLRNREIPMDPSNHQHHQLWNTIWAHGMENTECTMRNAMESA